MHERLVGEEVALEIPHSADALTLVIGLVENLMEVGGAGPDQPQRIEKELKTAIDTLCGDGAKKSGQRLEATLRITAEGVEVRLVCRGSGVAEQRLTVRES